MNTYQNIKRHVIIGPAGHIAHGKSSFVKALIGADPNRLKKNTSGK